MISRDLRARGGSGRPAARGLAAHFRSSSSPDLVFSLRRWPSTTLWRPAPGSPGLSIRPRMRVLVLVLELVLVLVLDIVLVLELVLVLVLELVLVLVLALVLALALALVLVLVLALVLANANTPAGESALNDLPRGVGAGGDSGWKGPRPGFTDEDQGRIQRKLA